MIEWNSERHERLNNLFNGIRERTDSWVDYWESPVEICLDGYYGISDLKEIVKIMEKIENDTSSS